MTYSNSRRPYFPSQYAPPPSPQSSCTTISKAAPPGDRNSAGIGGAHGGVHGTELVSRKRVTFQPTGPGYMVLLLPHACIHRPQGLSCSEPVWRRVYHGPGLVPHFPDRMRSLRLGLASLCTTQWAWLEAWHPRVLNKLVGSEEDATTSYVQSSGFWLRI